MNDHELEQRLSGWYRAEFAEGPAAPPVLRASVLAIPASAPASPTWPRRTLLMAATLAVVGVGGAIAIGSNLVQQPSEPPIPPSHLVQASQSERPSSSSTPDASPIGVASPIPHEPGFQAAGEMTVPRFQHTATLLEDGRVLIVGGRLVDGSILGSTEVWDPPTGSFTPGQTLSMNRFGHTATRLLDGRVLIVGGFGGRPSTPSAAKEIELWDPSTGTFRLVGFTELARGAGLSTVLLRDGRVLILSGGTCAPQGPAPTPNVGARLRCQEDALKTEVWDPATETTTLAGSLIEEQDWGAATLLDDGRVFVLGGGHLPTIGAELWDPATQAWSGGGAPSDSRLGGQTVTLLPDGRVAVIGGYTGTLDDEASQPPLSSIEVWDPSTRSYARAGSLGIGRERHRAVLLPDGRVLVVGGFGDYEADLSQTPFAEAEVWDPATGATSSAGRSATGRGLHTVTLLRDGRVLVVGGITQALDGEPVAGTALAEIWAP